MTNEQIINKISLEYLIGLTDYQIQVISTIIDDIVDNSCRVINVEHILEHILDKVLSTILDNSYLEECCLESNLYVCLYKGYCFSIEIGVDNKIFHSIKKYNEL